MPSAIGHNITFRYQDQTSDVLKNISFSITPRLAIGLVGANGSGKSTLMKILMGALTPTSGSLIWSPSNTKIGYLAQSSSNFQCKNVFEFLWQTNPDLYRMKCALDFMMEQGTDRGWQLLQEFGEAGGYDFESRIDRYLQTVGLTSAMLEQPMESLSGGERTKVGILSLLANESDILLLDEPTNHLDAASLEWLRDFLASMTIPYIIVSHDRHFLNQSVGEIWEIKSGSLTTYSGNYEFYKTSVHQEHLRKIEAYRQSQKKINKLEEAARSTRAEANSMENFKATRSRKKNGAFCKRDEGSGSTNANPTKKMRTAKAMEGRIQKMLQNEVAQRPQVAKERKISLPMGVQCMTKSLLRVKDLTIRYGENTVFTDLSLEIFVGQRIAIVGPNGSGKTSLLNVISGDMQVRDGAVFWSSSAKTSYFAQDNLDLKNHCTVLEEVWNPDLMEQYSARTVLGSLGLDKEKAHQSIATLSPGEKVKVGLAKVILSGANTLILDEPTNHLEITAREMLEEALLAYEGSVIFVSHDLDFTKKIATHVFDLSHGDWLAYPSLLDDS